MGIVVRSFRSRKAISFSNLFKTLSVAVLIPALIVCAVLLVNNIIRSGTVDQKAIAALWNGGNYEEVYRITGELETKRPGDYFVLCMRGFSAFQLSLVQTSNKDMLAYIDECIWTLRKTLILKDTGTGIDPSLAKYILGKAYYYKGAEWADMAVVYLEGANAAGYSAPDIPEYLGLSYAAIHEYEKSIQSYSAVLDSAFYNASVGESADDRIRDLVLLNIAKSYIELDEDAAAKAYLTQCLEISPDEEVRVEAQLLLAGVYSHEGNYAVSEAAYLQVLEWVGENAKTRFLLGELYEKTGDLTKARAEWRKSIRADPTFEAARAKLGL
jgi:tetratricopeptide (TPR) repeat protein